MWFALDLTNYLFCMNCDSWVFSYMMKWCLFKLPMHQGCHSLHAWRPILSSLLSYIKWFFQSQKLSSAQHQFSLTTTAIPISKFCGVESHTRNTWTFKTMWKQLIFCDNLRVWYKQLIHTTKSQNEFFCNKSPKPAIFKKKLYRLRWISIFEEGKYQQI